MLLPDVSAYLRRSINLYMLMAFVFSFNITANAQADTTVVDTISFTKIDSLTQPDDEYGYADTTVKHIYDTSQYFFNWKDDFHQPFAKQKFLPRHLIEEDVKVLKSTKEFWYIPVIEKMERRLKTDSAYRDSLLKANHHGLNEQTKKDFRQQAWFRFLVWFIIIGTFITAVIYFLMQNKINLFIQQPVSSPNTIEEAHENIFELPYTELLHKTELEQNYRVAVRLMFLQTLKILTETNNINYQPDYTNQNYLQQLHQSKFYNGFATLTRNYEYVWYGKFKLQPEQFTSIKNNFLIFQHSIT